MLDDRDEFESRRFFFWAFAGMGKTDTTLYKQLQEDARRYRALSDRKKQEEALRWREARGRARKGEPDKRETPLLSNTPRTTPQTAKQSSDRQLSTIQYSPVVALMSGLDDKDEWETLRPPSDAANLRFNALYYQMRMNGRTFGR